ncbi:hypothetical protein FEM48_Zijuj01G0322400 [Ziziphus jujuba var. spinosa]|uniref:EGF-like domain-containing protein n=1 Tax=Ziziphus jujuba var. spinosa TaxID=714518 RepID=A0A978W6H2_ZIZJJ|nr:hypothetical protein FEM48_Zijuj01G0322400 [Ziziphus jujuba var. spinosa]
MKAKRRHLQQLLLLLVMMLSTLSATKATSQIIRPGCLERCGSVDVRYPFGTSDGGKECYLDESFLVICNHSFNPPKLFFRENDVPITSMSPADGELRVATSISRECYNEQVSLTGNKDESFSSMYTRFPVSTRNKFTAVGCGTIGIIENLGKRSYNTGCISSCHQIEDVKNGTCYGAVGCCQMSIPEGVFGYIIKAGSLTNDTAIRSFNPCAYAFVADDEAYNFSSLDLANLQNRVTFDVVLDWSVGNETCENAKQGMSTNACRANNSECINPSNVGGYRCICSQGYHGNPYLPDGCQDVNECESHPSPCHKDATCHNLIGNFTCLCRTGFEGDGRNATGCSRKVGPRGQTRLAIELGEDDHGATNSNTTSRFDSLKNHFKMPYDDGR